MKEPVLVIMAAGLGSRYGGLKQMDPVSDKGEIILDFSLYDAYLAGFKKAIFIIKEEHEADFRDLIDHRAGKHMEIAYAFQKLEDIPKGYTVPEGRVKPWGTCHAVMAARHEIDGPFAVINADDYYGPGAFQSIYDYLLTAEDDDKYRFAMVGYDVEKTLTENGTVSRGVCQKDEEGFLTDIVERTKIGWKDGKVAYAEEDKWVDVPLGTPVSMNFWGFTKSMMDEMIARFPAFLDSAEPIKGEYFLPGVVDQLLKERKATVKVLNSHDKWYGVTYREDKETVVNALQSMKDNGLYPDILWK
ncbi:MAG: nucleotidyltransferase [Clostridia bacterium]|nr:nucleotidyltransferase [Clostridia bacterium]